MKNLLNLKKKDPSDIVIVEKIVLKDRSPFFELFRMLTIIAVASGVVWGISNADNLLNPPQTADVQPQNFSVVGTISEIATTTSSIILNNAKGTDDSGNTTYIVDTTNLSDIETNHFVTLSFSDIKVGDNIIAQGVERGSAIQIYKIYSYGAEPATGILEAATSTDDVVATTTPDVSTSTDATTTSTSTDATSTPSIIDNISNAVSGAAQVIKDATQNIIDTITGTTTGTSTDEVASPTPVTPEVTPPVVVPAPVVPPTVDSPVVDTPAPTSEAPPAN
jgi:hypothetical protein